MRRHDAWESDIQSLRDLVERGRARELKALIARRTWHLGIINQYELSVLDPDHRGRLYIFVITKCLGGPYGISELGVGYMELTRQENPAG
jgi:hypothetical protein